MHDDKRLQVALGLLFLVGCGFIVVARMSQGEAISRLLADLFRDVGIALCIAVVVATIVEISLTRKAYLLGLDAIMMRTVPEDVWQEFRQDVVTQPVMREDLSVVMRFKGVNGGRCISTTTLMYTFLALQDDVDERIHHEVDDYRTPVGAGTAASQRERFISASVGDQSYEDHTTLSRIGALSPDELKLTIPVHLDKCNDRRLVTVKFLEELSCPDTICWWMYRVTRNLTVKIEGLPSEWSVDTTTPHPAAHKLHVKGECSWEFKGIMMPGQGIELRFQQKPASSPRLAVTAVPGSNT